VLPFCLIFLQHISKFTFIIAVRVLVARLFLLFKIYYVCTLNEKAMPFEANLRVHDRAAGACLSACDLMRLSMRPLSGVKVKSRPNINPYILVSSVVGLAFQTTAIRRHNMKNCDIHINVVIETTNNLQSPHAIQVEKAEQVDSDKGSKLTRLKGLAKGFGAVSTFVVGLHKLYELVQEFFQ